MGPVPKTPKKAAETTVVTWVSIIVKKALSNPASTAAAADFTVAQFLADALEDEDVGIHAHADGQDDAGDARKRQHGSGHREKCQEDDQVEE